MLAMYKYSLFKYIKSWSTWIILCVTILIVIMIAGYLPTHFISRIKNNPQLYAKLSLIIVSSTTTFVAIFTSVFSGFKSATMYRDEIEDGSLLVMLSKPLTRRKILLSKWLALQTTIAVYTFVTALCFLLTVEATDIGRSIDLTLIGTKSLASKAFTISLLMWLVLEVLAVIFSSIGLLVSSKFTIGVSAGICIGIGVIIPITSIIGTFASKQEYKDISTKFQESNYLINTGKLPNISEKDIPAEASDIYKNLPDLKSGTPYKIGIETGESDSFKWMQIFDVNYQVQKLSEFASEQAIDQDKRNLLNMGGAASVAYKQAATFKENNNFDGSIEQQINIFNKMIFDSWEKTSEYRNILLVKAFEKIAEYNWDKPYSITHPTLVKMLGSNVLNNQTKQFFDIKDLYSWIFKRTPITNEVIAKYSPERLRFFTTLFATNAEATAEEGKDAAFTREYGDIIRDVSWFMNELGPTDSPKSVNAIYKDWGAPTSINTPLLATLSLILHPVYFWINSSEAKEFRMKTGYASGANNMNEIYSSDKGTPKGPGFITRAILGYSWDKTGYFEIISAIKAGHNLAFIKHVEYSNKYTILLIYLALGLLLLPATYLVIRKQDFR